MINSISKEYYNSKRNIFNLKVTFVSIPFWEIGEDISISSTDCIKCSISISCRQDDVVI